MNGFVVEFKQTAKSMRYPFQVSKLGIWLPSEKLLIVPTDDEHIGVIATIYIDNFEPSKILDQVQVSDDLLKSARVYVEAMVRLQLQRGVVLELLSNFQVFPDKKLEEIGE